MEGQHWLTWQSPYRLTSALKPISTVHKRFQAIRKIEGSDSAEEAQRSTESEFLRWAVEQLKEVLANPKQVHKRDGIALADLMRWEHSDDSLFER